MKVVVTGATGFIGNHVVRELLKRDAEVISIGRDVEKARNYPWFRLVEFRECDIEKFTERDISEISKADKIIHLAWRGLPNYKSLFHFEEVLMPQYRFLKAVVNAGIRDLTVTGTCLEYGMREGPLSTDMPADPQNPYALAKDSLRKFLVELQRHTDFNMKWLRLFYMYGPGQSEKSILSQLEKALSNGEKSFNMSGGEQLRDYSPVEDVAQMIVGNCMDQTRNGIFNCCSGVPISIKKLVDDYLRENRKQIQLNLGYYPYPDYEPMEFWGIKSD